MGNQIRTTVLLAAMTALMLLIGRFLGGQQGMIIAFVIAIGINFFSYWFSDKIVLKMYRAQEVADGQAPEVYDMVRELARRAQLPMPRVYIIPQEAPNAFATGRNPQHAVVAVTSPGGSPGVRRSLAASTRPAASSERYQDHHPVRISSPSPMRSSVLPMCCRVTANRYVHSPPTSWSALPALT